MAEEDGQERTEEPTPRRLEQAREKGQIPRSRELSTALLTLGGSVALVSMGAGYVDTLLELMRAGFALEWRDIFEPTRPAQALGHALLTMLGLLAPFLLLMWVLALLAPIAIGGWNWSAESLAPKWERLDPLTGIGRLFSLHALAELGKALAKFLLVGSVAIWVLHDAEPELLGLAAEPLPLALAHAGTRIGELALWLAAPLLLIAGFDVPFTLWQHAKELRMTLQEVKDEMKDIEGRPEIKGKLRRMQMEFAQRRMMDQVPGADAVIVNPEHYAVALKYEAETMKAPKVLALGIDEIALRIRALAGASGVPVVESPLLARALYYNAKIDRDIPVALYLAVAQVLAYVFQLRADHELPGAPIRMPEVEVP
ncbi:MAG TPA: flagellar biosynthesis protein FlhB, partial [Plasticicumulans sp.]|nr:flagellar biosynthesis protein FlhB [Plasticicumulans sp.]HND99311.1 flagellar biosynthesis protein FlhB [Plasticicumulans sp.]